MSDTKLVNDAYEAAERLAPIMPRESGILKMLADRVKVLASSESSNAGEMSELDLMSVEELFTVLAKRIVGPVTFSGAYEPNDGKARLMTRWANCDPLGALGLMRYAEARHVKMLCSGGEEDPESTGGAF